MKPEVLAPPPSFLPPMPEREGGKALRGTPAERARQLLDLERRIAAMEESCGFKERNR